MLWTGWLYVAPRRPILPLQDAKLEMLWESIGRVVTCWAPLTHSSVARCEGLSLSAKSCLKKKAGPWKKYAICKLHIKLHARERPNQLSGLRSYSRLAQNFKKKLFCRYAPEWQVFQGISANWSKATGWRTARDETQCKPLLAEVELVYILG